MSRRFLIRTTITLTSVTTCNDRCN